MIKVNKIFSAFTAKEKVIFWSAAAILLISAAGLLAIFVFKYTEIVPTFGGDYSEGMIGQPTYINPVLAASEIDRSLVQITFANLASLAEKMELDPNQRIWRVRLKQNLRWSNDSKLTSDDVIFTVQKIQDPETKSPLYASWQGVTATRQSELELQFNLVSPYPFFAETLKQLQPIPKHLFGDIPAPNWKLSEYNLKPVGSGPYRFENYEKQTNGFLSFYQFLPNSKFGGEKPFISKIEIHFFSRNEDLTRAFNGGLLDGFGVYDSEILDSVNRPHQVLDFKLPSYYAVFWNRAQNAVLMDDQVRNVLANSVDRDELVKKVLQGRGEPVYDPLPNAIMPYTEANSVLSTAEAKSILEKNGWQLNSEGIYERKEKSAVVKLEFNLTVPKIKFLLETSRALVDTWARVGVKVNLIEVAPEEIAEKVIRNRNYQGLLYGNVLNPATDLYSFWHSNERFHPGLNLAIFQNSKADKLIEDIRREADSEKRVGLLGDLRQTIHDDYPAVFLFSPDYMLAAIKDLGGVEQSLLGDAADRFEQINKWYLRTARTLKH